MRVYTYSEARQKLASVLDEAREKEEIVEAVRESWRSTIPDDSWDPGPPAFLDR